MGSGSRAARSWGSTSRDACEVVTGVAVVVVCVAADGSPEDSTAAVGSVRAHTPADVPIAAVPPGALAAAVADAAPADVVVLDPGTAVGPGWLDGLRAAAAHPAVSVATVSALTTGALGARLEDLDGVAGAVRERALRLRPDLDAPAPPCVLYRREALDLAGPLDAGFAERARGMGLAHVLADDVVVSGTGGARPPAAPVDAPAADLLTRAFSRARRAIAPISVTIDGRSLASVTAGTEVLTLELVGALARTGRVRLRVVGPPEITPPVREAFAAVEGVELISYHAAVGPDRRRTDIVHRPYQVYQLPDLALLRLLGDRVVITQQDSILYRIPGYFPSEEDWRTYRRVQRQSLAAAERVVFSTPHARGDALADELVDAEQAVVVPIGTDHRLAVSPSEPRRPDGVPDLPGGFLLCLGSDLRHKNRLFALRLLEELREVHGWDGALVLAGGRAEHGSSAAEEEAFLAERPGLAPAVARLGPVSEAEKAWLMEHAAAVAYPSVYEGFGLVPFEAARAGVPCLFAHRTSLADITPAETATLVPWDVAASAPRVLELLRNPEARARHVSLLRERAERYSWDATAAGLLDVYEAAADAPARAATALAWESAEREELMRQAQVEIHRGWSEYNTLRETVGEDGISLVGPGGALPGDVQRALLAVSARGALRNPLFAVLRAAYRLGHRAGGDDDDDDDER